MFGHGRDRIAWCDQPIQDQEVAEDRQDVQQAGSGDHPGHPQRPVGSTGWGVIGVTGSGDAHAPVGDRTNSRPVTRGGNGTSLLISGRVSFLAFPSRGASRRASSLRCLRPTTLGRSTSMQRQGAR